MNSCYCCDKIISATTISEEHIIPNALGGKLKSRNLLCGFCNSKLGREVDGPFCHQMGFVVNRLGIKREKGIPPAIKARMVGSGDPVYIESDRTTYAPRTFITQTERGYTITCDRRNARQAKKSLSRKVPNHQITLTELTESDVIFQHDGDLGGIQTFRAVAKIALNYYLHRNGSADAVRQFISFVTDGGINTFVIPYYCTRDVLQNRLPNHLTHAVVIRGDPAQKFLYAYVELFAAFRFFVALADPYDGDYVNDAYCFDLRQPGEMKTEALFYESRTSIAARAASSADVEAFKLHLQNLFAGDLEIKFF